jgi:hypothetical protein
MTVCHQARDVRICHTPTLDLPQPNFRFATIEPFGLQRYQLDDKLRLRGRSMVTHSGHVLAAMERIAANVMIRNIKRLINFPRPKFDLSRGICACEFDSLEAGQI